MSVVKSENKMDKLIDLLAELVNQQKTIMGFITDVMGDQPLMRQMKESKEREKHNQEQRDRFERELHERLDRERTMPRSASQNGSPQ